MTLVLIRGMYVQRAFFLVFPGLASSDKKAM